MNGMASGKILRRQRTHLGERPWRYSPRRQRTDNRGPRGLYWPSPTSAARRGGGNTAKIICSQITSDQRFERFWS